MCICYFNVPQLFFLCSAGAKTFGRARGGRDGPWNAVSKEVVS
jgi:hypothetical protein